MNYSQRGGINVITERSTRTSKLLIAKATSADSGNYTCSPSSSGEFPHFPSGQHPSSPFSTSSCPASCASLLVLQRRAEQLHLHLTPTRTMLLPLLLTQTPTSLSCCLSMCQSPVSFYCRWQLMWRFLPTATTTFPPPPSHLCASCAYLVVCVSVCVCFILYLLLHLMLARALCRLRLCGGACHKRRTSGRHATWQQQRQLLALQPRAFICHHSDDDDGCCCLCCHLELELGLGLGLVMGVELEQPLLCILAACGVWQLLEPTTATFEHQLELMLQPQIEWQSRPSWGCCTYLLFSLNHNDVDDAFNVCLCVLKYSKGVENGRERERLLINWCT